MEHQRRALGLGVRRALALAFPAILARVLFRAVLRRPAGREELDRWRRELRSDPGRIVPLVNWLVTSAEYQSLVAGSPAAWDMMSHYLHLERCRVVHALPPSPVIVDLGGASPGDPRGALLAMGYPHRFERLTIVDVPPGKSFEQRSGVETFDVVRTGSGPVHYAYRHMKDAGRLDVEPGSVDLVWMGESVEHVTEAEFDDILPWIVRSLRPGGRLGIDTPNRRVTRLLAPDSLIHSDHKIEYEVDALRAKLTGAGLVIELEGGIGRADESLRTGRLDPGEIIWKSPLNSYARDSYLMVLIAAKPT
jgi:hypothetical protein